MSSYSLLYIEWLDAADLNNSTWTSKSEVEKLAKDVNTVCKQYGILVTETKDSLILASSIIESKDKFNEDVFGNIVKVPKKMILKKTKINHGVKVANTK